MVKPDPSDAIPRTERTRLRRFHERGIYDRATIYAILDAGLLCHIGFADASGQPYVIPTAYVRVDDALYLHGSAASRTLRAAAQSLPLCVTVTHNDGLVLARTAFNHSFNYRSVVIFGEATAVTDPAEREFALSRLTDGLIPGRWADVRKPTRQEIKATSLLTLPLTEASAKIRTGPPGDEGEDLEHDAWAGVIPFELTVLPPVPDPKLRDGVPLPDYVAGYTFARRPPVPDPAQ